MTRETYIKMLEPFKQNQRLSKAITIINKVITSIIFLLYPILLGYLLINKDPMLFRAIVVPLDGFIILSVFRYLVNRPRPYEKFGVDPVIAKDTKGKSFPSRHVFSGYVIAMTFWFAGPLIWLAIVLFALSFSLAVIRVVTGVHYISDVVVGALAGAAAGFIGFMLI